jgi:hypothetical protein
MRVTGGRGYVLPFHFLLQLGAKALQFSFALPDG